MDEMTILAMLLCVGLAVIGWKMRMWPVAFLSSLGWVVISIRIFDETGDLLVFALILSIAFLQIILVRASEGKRWP